MSGRLAIAAVTVAIGCSFAPRAQPAQGDAGLVDAPPDVMIDAPVTPGAPSSPGNVRVIVGDARLDLAWDAPGSAGTAPITAYTATGVPSDGTSPVTCTGPDLACTLMPLTDGVTYAITVVAHNSVGDGAPSSPLDAVPLPAVLLSGSGLELWLDANAPGPTTAAHIATWVDRSPNLRAATQGSANDDPTLGALQSLAAVTFDGGDDTLATPAFVKANASYTIFTVFADRDATLPIANHVSTLYATKACGNNNPGFAAYAYTDFGSNPNVRIPDVEAGNAIAHTAGIDEGPQVTIANNQGNTPNVTIAEGTWHLLLDEVHNGSNAGSGDDVLHLGRYSNVCDFGHVSLGELVMFSSIQAADVTAIEAYLVHRWRLTVTP